MTPFHAAAERGRCEEILGCLIAKAGDSSINIKDDDEVSIYHVIIPGRNVTFIFFYCVTAFEVLYY